MNLTVKKGVATTSVYDGKLEVCQFVSGSSSINKKYADLFAKSDKMKSALEEIVYGIETGLGNKHQLELAKKVLNELAQ